MPTEPTTVTCRFCHTQYSGLMEYSGGQNLYSGYVTEWCPVCVHLQKDRWWQQTLKFTVQSESLLTDDQLAQAINLRAEYEKKQRELLNNPASVRMQVTKVEPDIDLLDDF